MEVRNKRFLSDRRIQTTLLIVYDIAAIMAAYFFALWFRFDCQYSAIPNEFITAYAIFCPIYAVFCVVLFFLFRFYNMIWSFVGYYDFIQVIAVSACLSGLHIFGITIFFQRMPISYYIIGMFIQAILVSGIRLSYRLWIALRNRSKSSETTGRVMIIGAGASGQMIIRDI